MKCCTRLQLRLFRSHHAHLGSANLFAEVGHTFIDRNNIVFPPYLNDTIEDGVKDVHSVTLVSDGTRCSACDRACLAVLPSNNLPDLQEEDGAHTRPGLAGSVTVRLGRHQAKRPHTEHVRRAPASPRHSTHLILVEVLAHERVDPVHRLMVFGYDGKGVD